MFFKRRRINSAKPLGSREAYLKTDHMIYDIVQLMNECIVVIGNIRTKLFIRFRSRIIGWNVYAKS